MFGLIVLESMFLIAIGLIIVFFVGYYTDPNFLFHAHPTDEQLIQNFEQHKSEFQKLANLLMAEKELLVILPDSGQCQYTNLKSISIGDNPSCAHFVQIFRDLGLDWAYTGNGNSDLWLTVSTSGLAVSGSSKGYYYAVDGIPSYTKIVENTDKADGNELLRHIEGNWYIFFSH